MLPEISAILDRLSKFIFFFLYIVKAIKTHALFTETRKTLFQQKIALSVLPDNNPY